MTANASSQRGLVDPSDQRHAQPVGVLVELLERDALRAEEAVREHVLGVAADALHGRPSTTSIARPHVASHSGHVR